MHQHTVAVRVLCIVPRHMSWSSAMPSPSLSRRSSQPSGVRLRLGPRRVVPLTAVLRGLLFHRRPVDQVVTPVGCSILVLVHGVVMSLTTVVWSLTPSRRCQRIHRRRRVCCPIEVQVVIPGKASIERVGDAIAVRVIHNRRVSINPPLLTGSGRSTAPGKSRMRWFDR